ncbi:MAG: AbiV family abortive infection protein [Calditrichaeota bacterium]|nr:AbiV family abortive infection protein [Calditrichota bacterium]
MKIGRILKSERKITLTEELLVEYYSGALKNSDALIEESNLLFKNKSYARCYFLACSSIEESGKAVEAFLGLGRNLTDPAVQKTLIQNFEDHNKKLLSALMTLLSKPPFPIDKLDLITDISLQLFQGREKSLYTDINKSEITIPK